MPRPLTTTAKSRRPSSTTSKRRRAGVRAKKKGTLGRAAKAVASFLTDPDYPRKAPASRSRRRGDLIA